MIFDLLEEQLQLSPEFSHLQEAPPEPTFLVPPLRDTPPPDLGIGQGDAAAMTDVFGHLTEAPPEKNPTLQERFGRWIESLGSRKGLQADKDGAGTTLGDWRLRVKPEI